MFYPSVWTQFCVLRKRQSQTTWTCFAAVVRLSRRVFLRKTLHPSIQTKVGLPPQLYGFQFQIFGRKSAWILTIKFYKKPLLDILVFSFKSVLTIKPGPLKNNKCREVLCKENLIRLFNKFEFARLHARTQMACQQSMMTGTFSGKNFGQKWFHQMAWTQSTMKIRSCSGKSHLKKVKLRHCKST